jgi:hypothetical protein
MKIRELLTEKELKDVHSSTLPGMYAYPEMPANDPYEMYRFSMGMANHEEMVPNSAMRDSSVIAAYSKGEEEIITKTEKKLGKRGKTTIADGGSNEPEGTNSKSPVAAKKKNKYGV